MLSIQIDVYFSFACNNALQSQLVYFAFEKEKSENFHQISCAIYKAEGASHAVLKDEVVSFSDDCDTVSDRKHDYTND